MTPLTRLIAEARAELHAETPTVLHTHHAPKLLDADGVASHYPDEGGIGLPLTAQMHRLLALRERFSPEFLMRESMLEVSDMCRSKHPEHDFPGSAKPLCAQLTYAVVVGGQEPYSIAAIGNWRTEVVTGLLIQALRHAEQWRIEQRSRAGFVEDAQSETVSDRLRREHDVAHEERAWILTRTKYTALHPWDRELELRTAEHKRLGCVSCPLVFDRAA